MAERPGYVSPSGVGYDIGCGSKAALTDLRRDDLDALGGVDGVMGEITRRISFAVGVPAQERVDHPVVDRIRGADFAPQRKLAQLAESQLGTVGSGNHYVNLMADEDDRVWVGVHFGSRQAVRLPKPRLRPDHGWRALPGAPGCRCDEDVGGRQVKPGLVDWPAVQARLREQGIVLVGGGADEAAEVYKRLPDVLAAHAGTIRGKHRLRPLGVAMAGRGVHDPYKD